ncbi:DUF2911 domain-containing protein [Nibrella saemangeumensis]|uniref:DUF2911 domain-containing protein n=1 Tax=Nibrella saemangeumensis TaxID=1084526 RepID=A0ABP8NJL1_9BACT
MKKLVLSAALALSLVSLSQAQIATPAASPAATVAQTVGLAKVTVDYSRPALKGRKMFSDQVPYGKVWRTGANMITKLTVSDEVMINNQKLAAGSYGIYTIPNANEWTIILNKDANAFGAFAYKQENDVMRFTVKPVRLATPAEFFTIDFTDFTPTTANLAMRWENTQVSIPVKHDPDARIMAQIQEQTAKPDANMGIYFAAADYYYQTNRDMKQALEWANKVVDKDKQYWTYYLRAKIAAKMGDCKAARTDAQQGLALAQKAGDDAYIKNHQQILSDCKM